MPLPLLVKVGVPLGAILYFAFGGGDEGGGPRPPYTKKIPVPGNDVAWDDMDEAICLCYEAGEQDGVALVNCALARVYPDVDWPAQPDDHVSVMRTWQATGARVANHLKLVAEGKDPCATLPPPPPPKDGPEAPASAQEVSALFRDAPESFVPITKTHNTNASSSVVNAYGVPANSANVGRIVIARVRVGFNLLFYSRHALANDYGAARITGGQGQQRYYDINAAWLPVNNRVITAAATAKKLARGIGWSGKSNLMDDDAYGAPWNPPINFVNGIAVGLTQDPWDPRVNPPARILAALGWTLAEMKQQWLAGNP